MGGDAKDVGRTVTVIQGNFAISAEADVAFSTILGSCVSVCLFDEVRAVGGMNHFLLPGEPGGTNRYGVHLMELLINGLLHQGAEKTRLRAKVFGGARMSENLRDIGSGNAEFARSFLSREQIPVLSESVGGRNARRVRFWPVTGAAQLLIVAGNVDEAPPSQPVPRDDITLF